MAMNKLRQVLAVFTLSVGAVSLSTLTLAQSTTNLPIRGVVRAVNTAAISTDLSVPIKTLNFHKGQGFKKGATLADFDCVRFEAERGALLAERKVHSLTVANNLSLLKLNAIGQFDLEVSKARLSKADAEVNRLNVRLSQCVVKAPFDGKVAEVVTRQYETPKTGVPFIKIIETGKLEIDFIIPSKWLGWVNQGTSFSFRIDETAKTYEGVVVRLGASVDPVSQTVEVRGRFSNANEGLLSGMSGSARFIGSES